MIIEVIMKPETHGIKTHRRFNLICTVLFFVSQLSGLASRAAAHAAPLNAALAAEVMAATAAIQGDKLSLSNSAIEAEWQVHESGLVASTLTDRLTNRTISMPPNAFVVSLRDGTVLKSSDMHVITPPHIEKLEPDPTASQLAARFGGWQIEVGLRDLDNRLQVTWRAVLRDGSAYVRQEVTLNAIGKDLPISSVRLVDVTIPGVRVYGAVKGSPIVAGNLFFGFEHPL